MDQNGPSTHRFQLGPCPDISSLAHRPPPKACLENSWTGTKATARGLQIPLVCNNFNNCHCDAGYAPPHCDPMPSSPGGSIDDGFWFAIGTQVSQDHELDNAAHLVNVSRTEETGWAPAVPSRAAPTGQKSPLEPPSREETTTFYEGCVAGSTMDNIPTVEEPEDPQHLGRFTDREYDLADNPKPTNGTSTDLEDHADRVLGEGAGAEKAVTDSDQKICQNPGFTGQRTDPIDGWPEFPGPEPTEEVATEDTKDAEGKAEIKSSQDEHQEDDELLANCKNQDGKVLMESSEQEENDRLTTRKKSRVMKKSMPSLSSEIPEKKQTQSHKDAQDAETQNHDSGKDDALQIRAPPEENLQLGSSCSPPPARVPPEDLPECKPPENPELAEVLQMPAGLPEGEPAEVSTELPPRRGRDGPSRGARLDSVGQHCLLYSRAGPRVSDRMCRGGGQEGKEPGRRCRENTKER
ncbi:Disintegrin and metalloproteinase domain-containing protein 5 [Fukomys damarensis]|uniref:Disintegrin and metalloproteinase domain-containing protein 5 n=1 Tax=Fukomys damarensis TaxID=885580 RepID=A0A091CWA3_FUKDA|nr:Disintegrin and metalloproteinase domain-containing protein 5 [Fukomys damarensis]